MAEVPVDTAPDEREGRVIERIEAFRRRRPRLRDAVVTSAHGAGGKASAALVDSVFLEQFGPADGPLDDAATLTLDSGERLAFTTDSFVVKPRTFPGGSIGHLAVNGTVNDLAVAWRRTPVALVRRGHRGGVPGRRAPRHRRRHGRGRGRRRRHASSPATPRWSSGERPTACTSPPPASGSCPTGDASVPDGFAPVTWCSSRARSAITAWP